MNRIDRLITLRLLARVAVVVVVFFGLILLVESLDGWRYDFLSKEQGPEFALLAIFAAAGRWSIKVLPITVLLGAIIALLDLQQHRELMVIKATGVSIWRLLRGPVLATLIIGLFISLGADTWITELNRTLLPVPRTTDANVGGPGQVWLEQNGPNGRFVIQATRAGQAEHDLSGATFFMAPGSDISRIQAEKATLKYKRWDLSSVTLLTSNKFPQHVDTYEIETQSTQADLALRLAVTDDFTIFELASALDNGISDPVAAAAASMRYAKLIALPMLLIGSLLIAFAFTAGYRRSGSYSGTIIYGIVLGFVVFVITEMADRAGSAGVLDPTFAAWGPAIVAIVTGVTVLLHKEDGRA